MLETRPKSPLSAEIPQSFSTRKAAGEMIDGVYMEMLRIPEDEVAELKAIHELLNKPQLQNLITDGVVTFALVKPSPNEGLDLPEDDDEAANKILEEIGPEVIFALPFKFRRADNEVFYNNLADKPDVFENVVEFMTSGPITAVLIYKEDAKKTQNLVENQEFKDGSVLTINGDFVSEDEEVRITGEKVLFVKSGRPIVKNISDMTEQEWEELKDRRVYFADDEGTLFVRNESAIAWWRDKMGATQPEDARKDPDTIRGKHAVELPKNIVHGSDSPDSVRRELRILDEALIDLINKNSEKVGTYNKAS